MAMNNREVLRRTWFGLRRFVLPLRCLLCGAAGVNGIDLCADCAAELPRNRSCCARCALPLAVPASRAAVGCSLGTIPLWLATGSAGVALQVFRRPRGWSGAVLDVATRVPP